MITNRSLPSRLAQLYIQSPEYANLRNKYVSFISETCKRTFRCSSQCNERASTTQKERRKERKFRSLRKSGSQKAMERQCKQFVRNTYCRMQSVVELKNRKQNREATRAERKRLNHG